MEEQLSAHPESSFTPQRPDTVVKKIGWHGRACAADVEPRQAASTPLPSRVAKAILVPTCCSCAGCGAAVPLAIVDVPSRTMPVLEPRGKLGAGPEADLQAQEVVLVQDVRTRRGTAYAGTGAWKRAGVARVELISGARVVKPVH